MSYFNWAFPCFFILVMLASDTDAQTSHSKERLIESLDEYRSGCSGLRLEIEVATTLVGSDIAPEKVSQILEASSSGDDWRVEQIDAGKNKGGEYERLKSYRFDWKNETTFLAQDVAEEVIVDSVGTRQKLKEQRAEYYSSWMPGGINPFSYVRGICLVGGSREMHRWLGEALSCSEDCSIRVDGGKIKCEFGVSKDNERLKYDEWKCTIVFLEKNDHLDLESVAVQFDFRDDASICKKFHYSYGPTNRENSHCLVDSCDLTIATISEGKLIRTVKQEFKLLSHRPCEIPEKLYFENVKITDGTRVITDSPVRYEYHEGEIYKVADDRSLKSIYDAKVYRPSFWKKYKTLLWIVGLLVTIGSVVLVRAKRKSG